MVATRNFKRPRLLSLKLSCQLADELAPPALVRKWHAEGSSRGNGGSNGVLGRRTVGKLVTYVNPLFEMSFVTGAAAGVHETASRRQHLELLAATSFWAAPMSEIIEFCC